MTLRRKRPALVATIVASLVAASALAVASPAAAADLIPGNEINGGDYTITLNPTERSGDAGGTSALVWGPGNIKISTGCPEGYRLSSSTYIVTAGGVETPAATGRTNAEAALWGLKGNPIELTSGRASNWSLLTADTFPSGVNRLVITCDATLSPDSVGDSKYFVAYIEVDRAAQSWKVIDRPSTGPEKTATTTVITAADTTSTSTSLTATVAPAEATGTVTFSQNGTPVGQPVAVTNGTATYAALGLTPSTEYSFTAAYSGDATHEASVSAARAVTTAAPAPVQDSAGADVSVTVPPVADAGPTGLKISTKPVAIELTGNDPRREGAIWTAKGQLGNVTVNDDRRTATTGWTLNGSATTFAAGTNEIAASALSWTPTKVSGTGSAGSAARDLSTAKTLAFGSAPTGSNLTTTVGAELALEVPGAAVAGDYKARLTLTLI